MSIQLSDSSYGKSRVRVKKLIRRDHHHEIIEMNVSVLCEGDFEAAHRLGDNRDILPTDTQKNTVYIFAKSHPLDSIESYALALSSHFIDHNPQLTKITIEITQPLWKPIPINGQDYPFACQRAGSEEWYCKVVRSRNACELSGGIQNLNILKTTHSGFSDFKRDAYTTLNDTNDRVFETILSAWWTYKDGSQDYKACREKAQNHMITTFATHESLSVQHTLYAMGKAALEAVPALQSIRLDMPNKHNLVFNFAPFDLGNDRDVFIVTDEPYGVIRGELSRD